MPNPLDANTVTCVQSNPAPFSGLLNSNRIPPVRTADDLHRLSAAQLSRWILSN